MAPHPRSHDRPARARLFLILSPRHLGMPQSVRLTKTSTRLSIRSRARRRLTVALPSPYRRLTVALPCHHRRLG